MTEHEMNYGRESQSLDRNTLKSRSAMSAPRLKSLEELGFTDRDAPAGRVESVTDMLRAATDRIDKLHVQLVGIAEAAGLYDNSATGPMSGEKGPTPPVVGTLGQLKEQAESLHRSIYDLERAAQRFTQL